MSSWNPSFTEVSTVVSEQNPWQFGDGAVPDALARTVERPLGQNLWRTLTSKEPLRYQLILGPRRVGKTTAMHQTIRRLLAEGLPPDRLWFLRLDHPVLLQVNLGELLSVVRQGAANPDGEIFVFLDELVYAENWDTWLKTFYDERAPVRIVGSSSATAALSRQRMESGVGRWEEQRLAPYLLSEYVDLTAPGHTVEVRETLAGSLLRLGKQPRTDGRVLERARERLMITGGFPEVAMLDRDDTDSLVFESQRILRADAVERTVYKDIPQSYGVSDPMALERLLYVLAGQMTGILSMQSIAQTLGSTQPTVDAYTRYLEAAFLVFRLPNYSGNESSVQRRGRKLYFVDGAVRNAALQRGNRFLADPGERGALAENMVASHMKALAEQQGVRLFHWRSGRDEVDLVYDDPNGPVALEVASSSSHHHRGLLEFRNRYPRFATWLTFPTATWVPPDRSVDGIGTVPTDLLLLLIGRQAERALRERLGSR